MSGRIDSRRPTVGARGSTAGRGPPAARLGGADVRSRQPRLAPSTAAWRPRRGCPRCSSSDRRRRLPLPCSRSTRRLRRPASATTSGPRSSSRSPSNGTRSATPPRRPRSRSCRPHPLRVGRAEPGGRRRDRRASCHLALRGRDRRAGARPVPATPTAPRSRPARSTASAPATAPTSASDRVAHQTRFPMSTVDPADTAVAVYFEVHVDGDRPRRLHGVRRPRVRGRRRAARGGRGQLATSTSCPGASSTATSSSPGRSPPTRRRSPPGSPG